MAGCTVSCPWSSGRFTGRPCSTTPNWTGRRTPYPDFELDAKEYVCLSCCRRPKARPLPAAVHH